MAGDMPGTRDARPADDIFTYPAARSQNLLDLLAEVPDPRKRRGLRHALGLPVDDVIRAVLRPCGRGDRILREVATSEARGKLSAIGELVFDSRGDVEFKGLRSGALGPDLQ